MEVKNTLLVISLILAIALATAGGGIFFYFSLQGQSLDRVIALEKKKLIKNRNLRKSEVIATMKGLVKRLDEQDTDAQGAPIAGLRKRLEEQQELLKTQDGYLDTAIKERTSEREKIRPADEGMIDAWHRLDQRIETKQKEISDEYKNFQTKYDEKLTQIREVREELVREMAKRADPELLRLLDEARVIEDEIRKIQVKLKRLREESRRRRTLEADGTIVHSDHKTSTVTINIGRAAGVRKGMLFDVFEIKRNGDRIRKAKIHVTRLAAEYATAIVLAARDPMPFCSNCGWEAYASYMSYCVFCTDGEDTNKDGIPDDAKKLTPGARELMIVSPDPLNPLVAGDLISNPFFERGRRYVFALGGTTAFRSRDEIRKFIESHGSQLQDRVTLSTDVLIVGVGPEVDAAVQEARKLGVKVIREKDLFTFFGGEERY